MKQIFNFYYKTNQWKSKESASGTGSTLQQTKNIRKALLQFIHDYKITSILDIPCGDFYWMKELDLENIRYTGADIVEDLIEENQKYKKDNLTFITLDLTQDKLPSADIILIRDCFVHFPFSSIFEALKNIARSRFKYLITTTFKQRFFNKDLLYPGPWRPLNLEIAPFHFSSPIQEIQEGCTESEGKYFDKTLSIWDISNNLN